MTQKQVRQILRDTAFVHTSATAEELKVAQYLERLAKEMGAQTHIEEFDTKLADIHSATLTADGKDIPCKAFMLCGSGSVTAAPCYLPNSDPASLVGAKGKIAILDTGVTHFLYQDLVQAGAVGIITYSGNVLFADNDIDRKELRPYVQADAKKILAVNINAKDAYNLVKANPKQLTIAVEQTEFDAKSRNVIAEIPAKAEASQPGKWLVLSAHYDTTPLSMGAYDNMTGCIGLLGILESFAKNPCNHNIRFIFCGSEERGLLGSKAYVSAHEVELQDIVLDINLDMIGTVMGRFIACISAEERLRAFIDYFSAQRGWGIETRMGVYSSDSTPFADKGVPALSFARLAPSSQASIHTRYDRKELVSEKQILKDIDYLTAFTAFMADSVVCPVKRDLPESVKKELDVYMCRKRKES